MSNVINFQQRLEERKDYLEKSGKINEAMEQSSQAVINFFAESRKDMNHDFSHSRTLSMIFEGIHVGLTTEAFKDGVSKFACTFSVNVIYTADTVDSAKICVRLANAHSTEKIPRASLTFLALGTKEGMLEEFQYNVDHLLADSLQVAISDKGGAQSVVYDYIYDHPAVDTPRDLGVPSIPAYSSVEVLLAHGYVLSRSAYRVTRDPQTQVKSTTELVVEFIHPDPEKYIEKVYMYFNYENSLRVIEVMMQELFGVGEDFRGPDSLDKEK